MNPVMFASTMWFPIYGWEPTAHPRGVPSR